MENKEITPNISFWIVSLVLAIYLFVIGAYKLGATDCPEYIYLIFNLIGIVGSVFSATKLTAGYKQLTDRIKYLEYCNLLKEQELEIIAKKFNEIQSMGANNETTSNERPHHFSE